MGDAEVVGPDGVMDDEEDTVVLGRVNDRSAVGVNERAETVKDALSDNVMLTLDLFPRVIVPSDSVTLPDVLIFRAPPPLRDRTDNVADERVFIDTDNECTVPVGSTECEREDVKRENERFGFCPRFVFVG